MGEEADFPRKEFYFIRHGETDWNVEGKFQGQTDIPLNDVGREQAESRVRFVNSKKFSSIYSSPLKRAFETACILADQLDVKIVREPLLMECSSEETARTIYSGVGGKKMPSFGCNKFPTRELPEEFVARSVQGTINALIGSGEQIPLIVAHGGTFWALSTFLKMRLLNLPNCIPARIYPFGIHEWKYELFWA